MTHYTTSDKSVFARLAHTLDRQSIVVVDDNDWQGERQTFFYTEQAVTVVHKGARISILSFCEGRTWYLLFSTPKSAAQHDDETTLAGSRAIHDYIASLTTGPVAADGYIRVDCVRGEYKYGTPKKIATGLRIRDLIGLNTEFDAVVRDIDRYRAHIDKHRAVGVNNGLNYLIHGSPGTGKTSFCQGVGSPLQVQPLRG